MAILLLTSLSIMGQEDGASCRNPKFDKTVDSYLSYSVPTISVTEACDKIEFFVFLDAREMEEYNVSHIKGAIQVGYDYFDIASVDGLSKDADIVIYCSIGYRSEKIGEILKSEGFTNVKNMYGSIFEWVNRGNPLVDNSNEKTNKIHAFDKKWGKWIFSETVEKIY